MQSNKKLKNFLVSLFVLAGTGCATMVPLEQVQDQEKFIQQVIANNPQIQTLKAKAKVQVVTKGKTYNFKIGLLMTNAAQMYIETYGLGVPQGYASLMNDRLTVIFPGEHEMYVGTGASSLTKLLKVNVTFNELFDPILKKIAISSEDGQPTVQMTSQHYIIKDVEKTFFEVNDSKWIDKIERRMGFLIEYGSPVSQSIKFPKSIRLSYEHQSIRLDFDDVTINKSMDTSAFQINVPSEGFHVSSIE